MITLIMPMAGAGSRFSVNGQLTPKPLIDLSGAPFFYRSIQSLNGKTEINQIIFVVLRQHIETHHIDTKIKLFFPEATIVTLESVLNGPVLTVLNSLEKISDPNLPIVINDCDHYFESKDFYHFLNHAPQLQVDGGILVFNSNDSRYSYAKVDGQGDVLETKEKVVISNHAICGAYFFKDKATLQSALADTISASTDKELYMSCLINNMIAAGSKTKAFSCEKHISFGTPEELASALTTRVATPWTNEG